MVEDGPGEDSYPSLLAAGDSRVHLVYSWSRECIAYVAVEPPKGNKRAGRN